MFRTMNVPTWYLSTPEGKRMKDQHEADHQTQRERLVAQLAEVEAASLKRCKAAQDKLTKAVAAREKAEASYRSAQQAVAAARCEAIGISTQATNERQRIERQLAEGADPAIAEFIARMHEAEQQTRNTEVSRLYRSEHVGPDKLYQRQVVSDSNYRSIGRRMEAIRAAREAAERLQFTAERDVSARLAELEAGIPPVVMEAV